VGIDTQEYEVKISFKYTGKVFDGDPDDRFELAEFEKDDIEQLLLNHLDDCDIQKITVLPVITPGK
jgi:hypothetical protein